jgi:hypothetical protein
MHANPGEVSMDLVLLSGLSVAAMLAASIVYSGLARRRSDERAVERALERLRRVR